MSPFRFLVRALLVCSPLAAGLPAISHAETSATMTLAVGNAATIPTGGQSAVDRAVENARPARPVNPSERANAAPAVVTPPLPPPPSPLTAPVEFFNAAASGDAAKLREHLQAGVAVDSPVNLPLPTELAALAAGRNTTGWVLREGNATPLMLAAAGGHHEAMAALLDAGANRYAGTLKTTRALDLAAMRTDVLGMKLLLGVKSDSLAERLSIVVDLSAQRAVVSRDGVEIFSTKISSGKKDKPTPPGTYVVTQKYSMWRSTLYNNAAMPFFMRLSCSAVGLHQGNLPGYPASHGCVRLPAASAKKLFADVPLGTTVVIR